MNGPSANSRPSDQPAPDRGTRIHELLRSSIREQQEFAIDMLIATGKSDDPQFVAGAVRFAVGRQEHIKQFFRGPEGKSVIGYLCRHLTETVDAIVQLEDDSHFRTGLFLLDQLPIPPFLSNDQAGALLRRIDSISDPQGTSQWQEVVERMKVKALSD